MTVIRKYLADESGATAIEYGLLAGLVAMAIVGALGDLRGAFQNMYNYVATEVQNSMPGGG